MRTKARSGRLGKGQLATVIDCVGRPDGALAFCTATRSISDVAIRSRHQLADHL
jgi:hypothetical protein